MAASDFKGPGNSSIFGFARFDTRRNMPAQAEVLFRTVADNGNWRAQGRNVWAGNTRRGSALPRWIAGRSSGGEEDSSRARDSEFACAGQDFRGDCTDPRTATLDRGKCGGRI